MNEYGRMQFQLMLMRTQYFHAVAVTGAYKFLKRSKDSSSPTGWRSLTDEEKLKRTLSTMNQHLHNAQSILDSDPV